MPHDDTLTRLLTRSAAAATHDVVAPESWRTSIPQRATRQRRRRTVGGAVAGTLAAVAVAVVIVVPRTHDDRATGTRPAAYTLTSTPAGRAAVRGLTCLTATPPAATGSTPVLSVGGAAADGSSCPVLQGRQDRTLPGDARAVAGHDGRYVGARTAGYRLGYRTYPSGAGDPRVLQLAVAGSVSTLDLLTILDSVDLTG